MELDNRLYNVFIGCPTTPTGLHKTFEGPNAPLLVFLFTNAYFITIVHTVYCYCSNDEDNVITWTIKINM